MTEVRLAVVGAGVVGKKHIETIRSTASAELIAIVDPFPGTEGIAVEAGVPRYVEVGSMLRDNKPDGVIVATPTEHHLAPCLAALDSGAHVLVEKPIAATLSEAEAIVAKSEQTGRHVLVGHHRRYYPQVHRAREIVRRGHLGRLVAVSGQWGLRKHDGYYEPDWRKRRAAGPVLTNLIHEMDCLRFICGEVTSISAETANSVSNIEKEDAAALIMSFENGALGSFVLSDQTCSPWAWEFATGENPAFPRAGRNVLRFMGTEASLEFPNLVVWRHDNGAGDWTTEIKPHPEELELGDAFAHQIKHFCAVIQGEQIPRITALDATRTLQATLAVFEAADSKRRVRLQAEPGTIAV